MFKKLAFLTLTCLSFSSFAQDNNWQYHERNFSDGKVSYTATHVSNDDKALLLVSNGDRKTLGLTLLDKNECIDGCDVLISFDKKETEKIHLIKGNVILFATFDESKYLIKELSQAKDMTIQIPSEHVAYTIHVDNLDINKIKL